MVPHLDRTCGIRYPLVAQLRARRSPRRRARVVPRIRDTCSITIRPARRARRARAYAYRSLARHTVVRQGLIDAPCIRTIRYALPHARRSVLLVAGMMKPAQLVPYLVVALATALLVVLRGRRVAPAQRKAASSSRAAEDSFRRKPRCARASAKVCLA